MPVLLILRLREQATRQVQTHRLGIAQRQFKMRNSRALRQYPDMPILSHGQQSRKAQLIEILASGILIDPQKISDLARAIPPARILKQANDMEEALKLLQTIGIHATSSL